MEGLLNTNTSIMPARARNLGADLNGRILNYGMRELGALFGKFRRILEIPGKKAVLPSRQATA